MSIPTIDEFNNLFPNNEICVKYLLEHDVFYRSIPCPSCERPMRRMDGKMVFRCYTKACADREISLRKHTFFYGSALSCLDIMRLGHLWLAGVTHSSAQILTGHSSKTITAFFKHFRNLVAGALEEEDQVIGGPGVVVEIDETKMGKRKYHRGHRVDGVWVVAGIERTETAKTFAIQVEDRSANTLLNIIETHVKHGSIVYTDCWKGYNGISDTLKLEHQTVNHSKNFKDPLTGVCTNKIEGLNNGLKMKISARNRVENGMQEHLDEFIWRKKNRSILWNSFVNALRNIHYEFE